MRTLAIIALVIVSLAGGAWRATGVSPQPYDPPWASGDQLVPLSVPLMREGDFMASAPGLAARLQVKSVNWGAPRLEHEYVVYVRISRQHWSRLFISSQDLELLTDTAQEASELRGASPREFRFSVADLLDDDDGDGDPLDAGELLQGGSGLQVLVLRNER